MEVERKVYSVMLYTNTPLITPKTAHFLLEHLLFNYKVIQRVALW